MLECGNCWWLKTCSTSEHIDEDDLCEFFMDIENFFDVDSEEWLEFSYNRYTEGCLDTEEDEYSLYPW